MTIAGRRLNPDAVGGQTALKLTKSIAGQSGIVD
jgi:hypothetical protein